MYRYSVQYIVKISLCNQLLNTVMNKELNWIVCSGCILVFAILSFFYKFLKILQVVDHWLNWPGVRGGSRGGQHCLGHGQIFRRMKQLFCLLVLLLVFGCGPTSSDTVRFVGWIRPWGSCTLCCCDSSLFLFFSLVGKSCNYLGPWYHCCRFVLFVSFSYPHLAIRLYM